MQKNHLVVVRCLVHQIIKSVVTTNYAFLKIVVLVVLPDRSRAERHMMAQTFEKNGVSSRTSHNCHIIIVIGNWLRVCLRHNSLVTQQDAPEMTKMNIYFKEVDGRGTPPPRIF